MRLIVIVPLVLIASCSLFGKRDKQKDFGEPTPAGYRVEYTDQGSVASGRLTKAEILLLFDAAQLKAKQDLIADHGVTLQQYELYARSTSYHLVDNKNFPANVSSTGFASGMTFGSQILVALYTRRVVTVKTDIPPGTPPWTIVRFNGKWSYGVLDRAKPFPALMHELGHRILPGKFEHPQ